VALGTLGGALFLLHDQADGVSRGLGLKTILGGLTTLLDLRDRNPLTYPGLTPLVTAPLVLLACLGWWRGPAERGGGAAPGPLTQRERRTRVLWLLAWLVGFVMAHGAVLVDEPLNNARYQLHALAPIVILSAMGLRLLQQRAPLPWAGAVLALLLAAPWLHHASITALDFAVVHERRFVEQAAAALPPDCTVLEVLRDTPYNSPTPRFGRAGRYRRGPRVQTPVKAVVAARVPRLGPPNDVWVEPPAPPPDLGDPRQYLTDAGKQALANPPACLVFYAGAHCKPEPGRGGEHPVCEAIRSARPFERQQTSRIQTQRYDGAEYGHLIEPTDTLEFTLWRANTRANPAPWLQTR
jgi:hypothetical protein